MPWLTALFAVNGGRDMQLVHQGVVGVRALARFYGDSVLVVTLIIAAISGAISLANILSATL